MKATKGLEQNQAKDIFWGWPASVHIVKYFEGIASDEDSIKAYEGIACGSEPLLPSKKVTGVIVDTDANPYV